MKISPTSLSITQLLGSTDEQYVIPAYQRRYSWYERQVWELIDDIRLIEDGDTHLLGSIVCLAGPHKAGLNQLELVDGQQRLTTIAILLECIRQRLEKEGVVEEVADLARLISAKPLSGKALRKICLDSIDSSEFDQLVAGDSEEGLQNENLAWAFRTIREWVAKQSLDGLHTFLYRLKNQAITIRLDVSEAKDAFKLFETINNRGLRLSPTDIIKNFLLGNAARFGEASLRKARTSWAEIIRFLDGTSSDAFFRYYLMAQLKTRITASEVVPQFKSVFMTQVKEASSLPERHLYADPDEDEDEDSSKATDVDGNEVDLKGLARIGFAEFLVRLVESARIYAQLVLANTGDKRIDRHLRNLQMIKAVQTYGFLMHLRANKCPDKSFRAVLKITESFVLRRHICRERANETEALFARLSDVTPLNPVPSTRDAYRELSPSDDKFLEEFAGAEFSANLIDRARYCLEQIELSKHGEHEELVVLGAEDVHVEHIIPQKIRTKKAKDEFGDWVKYLGAKADDMHPNYVSRIGNLTLFAGELNIGASNNPFLRKKKAYKESAIKLTKELCDLPQFKFRQVDTRSLRLAKLAVGIWPKP